MLAALFTPRAMLIAFAVFGSSGGALAADSAVSVPVGGFVRSTAATSDTLVSVPLSRTPVARGTLAGVAGNVLTANGSPGWTANLFLSTETHYVRLLTGTLAGQFLIITANGSNSLTVDAAGLNLAQIAAGDAFEVVPFWTLGTLYPPSAAGVAFTSSASVLSRQTEILFYDASATGINRAPSETYYFLNGAWRRFGDNPANSHNNKVIFPDSYVIQRNKAQAGVVTVVGRVQPAALGTVLESSATRQNDNYCAISFPVDVTLNQSGLIAAGFAASASVLNRADQILLFNLSATGINRAPSFTYYFLNNGWRRFGDDPAVDHGNVVLPAGAGFIIRKATASSAVTWRYSTGI